MFQIESATHYLYEEYYTMYSFAFLSLDLYCHFLSEEASLIIFGGSDAEIYNDVDVYTIHKNGEITWSHQARSMADSWSHAGLTVRDKNIYIIGGRDSLGNPHQPAVYDSQHDSWVSLPHMSKQRIHSPSVFILGQRLYVAGGGMGDSSIESIDLDDLQTGWRMESVMLPYNISLATAVVVKDTVYMCSGKLGSSEQCISRSLHHMDWTYIASTRAPHIDSRCMITDGEQNIWLLSKCTGKTCTNSDFFEVYSTENNSWEIIDNIPDVDFDGNQDVPVVCVYWRGLIVVNFWGMSTSDLFYVYNVKEGIWSMSHTKLRVKAYNSMAAVVK